MTPEDTFERTLDKNTEKLRILLEAMHRKGKSTLLDEKMTEILLKEIGKQKGAA